MPQQTVLVVEDEPLLLLSAMEMVEAGGFEAIGAADATAAVAILENRLDICIVFTDVEMPRGIDGLRLAALIRDRWPPIHVIITSGHSTPSQGSLPVDMMFFSKPYQEREVVAAMRKIAA
ncbi:response regulator [Mycoplana dimorpha]|uniref:Response regulator receiver domain-containing protein n=1 Tax=Mycoplana dimorpha TaxID=28320 RepID=A0A2T5AIB2_MYCDI|nr:response regulator [Mycoplana dimorpha]PTM86477.1 response regulator receiver domain-containing protein [Mycoplana dimorpha]